jgi:UDP-N-acetylglucosamine acyltransferase
MPSIHPTASVSPEAELADSVEIGPYCVLTGKVQLGPGVRLLGNNYIAGPVTIGEGSVVYPFACIGFPPQDVKFKPGDKTAGVVIGKHGQIREHVTIHAASNDHTPTTVGDKVFMMVNAHLGHDAKVGNNVIMVNNSAVGGHGQVHDNATLGGGVLIHQFTRVGRMAFISGGLAVANEIPPFCLMGERNRLTGLNQVGLRRSGMPREQITGLRRAFREALWRSIRKDEMLRILDERARECPPVAEIAQFIREGKRPLCAGNGKLPRALTSWVGAMRRGKVSFDTAPDDDNED